MPQPANSPSSTLSRRLAVATLAALLAGCGRKGNPTLPPKAKPADETAPAAPAP